MASVYREIEIEASPEAVWEAVRDVGAVHRRLFPGYLTNTVWHEGEGAGHGTRVVTFANGLVATERVVVVDDANRRVAWSAVGGRPTHHHAAMQVLPSARVAGRARLVWVTDVLPDELEPAIRALIDGGIPTLSAALEARREGST